MNTETQTGAIIRDLGDELILRRSRQEDADALVSFHQLLHSDEKPEKPDERVGAWTRDLMTLPHPTFHPEDFIIVENIPTGKIVSSMNLISQTWSYAGIEFGVGRPELVATLPEYRQRGLICTQFKEIHRWSEERSEQVQAITGIPFFYRQFGYEMCLDLMGGRTGYEAQLLKLKDGETEPYHVRPATETDIPFLMRVYAHACRRSLVTCVRNEAIWRYELSGQSEKNINRNKILVIESIGGDPVGYLIHPWYSWSTGLVAHAYELKEGISWLAVTPSVARYLWQTGGEYATRENKIRTTYGFWLGAVHPVYEVFRDKLPRIRDPYAWYLRIPDLGGFLRNIAPVLEQRIAESVIVSHSGEIKIGFYNRGLRLVLEHGKLTGLEDFKPTSYEAGDAAFPNLTFLQLLFGYRTMEELEQSYADCWYENDEARLVLTTLFPKKPSAVLAVI